MRRLTRPSLARLLYTVYPPPPYPVHYPADPSRRLRRPHPELPADGREPVLYCHREHRRGALGAVVIARVHVPAAHGPLRSTGSRDIKFIDLFYDYINFDNLWFKKCSNVLTFDILNIM